jgi:type IV pilus assembly protein PilW
MATVRRKSPAFGVPELLLAAFVASIVLSSLVTFVGAQVRTFRRTEHLLAANETVRIVLDVMSRDLRQAGFDPSGVALEALAAANATALTLQRDDDGDGTIDGDSEEVVAYVFRPAQGTLSRVVGRQSMPLADGLAADGFRLAYFDSAGTEITSPSGLDAAARAAVRRVRITLLLRDASRTALAGGSTEVALRNRPWTP